MNEKILKDIEAERDEKKAKILANFFKTGKGQYGEGDVFFGINVPVSRTIAKKYKDLSFKETENLLKDKVHEIRLIGVLILVHKYETGTKEEREKIVSFYLKNTRYINNWDLVDLSASKIIGEYLINQKNKDTLVKLAKSKNLWEQRISIISTLAFIRRRDLEWTFKIAEMFLGHDHDLIHKAVGWMLREAGKKDEKALKNFLNVNLSKMPRTMLRYAIEKFPEKIRLFYLKKKV